MITFVHLSDIHFIDRDHGTQFDLDQQVRRALLEDLERKPADGADYDGVLITGDIAFGGKHEQYKHAQDWINELLERTGAAATNTYMVPGNHDIDREFVKPSLPLWAAHEALRRADDPAVWHDHIYKQLVVDPLRSVLAPLEAYNNFAQGYGCNSGMVKAPAGNEEKPHLAWQRVFEKPLADGWHVRLHGLNSVLISDEGDAPGKMLVSKFQTSHFAHTPGLVDVVMCHHPPEWMMDKADVRNAIRSFAPVALFGHEHTTRIDTDANHVQLFAGAVQPSRRDPEWLPTYHIMRLGVENVGENSELVVQVHTREFDKNNYVFRPRRNQDDQPFEHLRVKLPAWAPPRSATTIPVATDPIHELSSSSDNAMPTAETTTPTTVETAQRELLVHFFRLGTPDRYTAANEAELFRDGDDALHPQAMWAEVFRRASQEGKLAKFWVAVAARTQALKNVKNPFTF